MRGVSDHRKWVCLLVTTVAVVGFALTADAVAGGRPAGPSPDERAFLGALDDAYAWDLTARLVSGGEVVAGTAKGLESAEFLADEMARIGLLPGGTDGSYLEPFPIHGWEDLGSSATILSPVVQSIPVAQAYKDVGTGPDGVTAPVVDVGLGRWEDFERTDIAGKIVLFHRQDPMFYGLPTLAEAKARGAVGALMDYLIIADDGLKNDVIGVSVPAVYIREVDSATLRELLGRGEEVLVRLVVNNRVGHAPMAYNVIGIVPGELYPEELVYLGAHFDHWFTSAADNNAGVGSLFAIAKAIVDAEIRPARTLVFVAFDSEELGGPPDTWYDWCLGSYSHIVGTLDGRQLHPDRPGRIAAMLNMDVIAAKDSIVFVETTPDLTRFIRTAARDAGLLAIAPTYVYWPPSSYDDWPFYMAGVPVMQIAWWGPSYDGLYHTTEDTMDKLDPAYLHVNMVFNGFAMIRMAQARILPYTLSENVEVAEEGIEYLLRKDPSALGPDRADIAPLREGIARYAAALDAIESVLASRTLPVPEAERINRVLMRSAGALNPHLFDWDTSVIPGWTGLFLFDTYANDLYWMNRAIEDLRMGRTAAAAKDLVGVTTMEWGQYVGGDAYRHVLSEIAFPDHRLWADGHLPVLTLVHAEYMALSGKAPSALDSRAVLASLLAKRDAIYRSVSDATVEAGSAFEAAADILGEI